MSTEPRPPKQPITIVRSPVETLLTDAILLAKLAHEHKGNPPTGENAETVCARASILNSVVTLEATAHVCAERALTLPKGIRRLVGNARPMFSRFDIILEAMHRPPLPRDDIRVKTAEAMVSKVRNKYVHPALQEQPALFTSFPAGGGVIEPAPGERLAHVGLSALPREWVAEDAVAVLRALCAFLDLFFFDACGLAENRVTSLVHDSEQRDGREFARSGPLWTAAYEARIAWGLRPRFLGWLYGEMEKRGVTWPDGKNSGGPP